MVPAFIPPEIAARHNHKIVRKAVYVAETGFNSRFHLARPHRDAEEILIWRTMEMFLLRARQVDTDGNALPALDYRRADHLQVLLSLWLVMIAIVDFKTWKLREPDHDLAKKSPWPTVWRLAELAGLIPKDRPYDPSNPPPCVERAMATFRNMGLIHFTKQERRLADGKWESTGGALRKLKAKVLARVGGMFGKLIRSQVHFNKKKKAQQEQAELEEENAIELIDAPPPSPPANEEDADAARYANQRTTPGQPAPSEIEAVMRELGTADWAAASLEVRRRHEGRRPARPPPDE